MNFAGLQHRYGSLDAWRRATELYGAFLAKYQTEWFRINRGNPFNAYRWHFFADWWGWAGGGLVDVDRKPKATYHALKAASRPVLVCTSLPNTIFAPGAELEFPIHLINELRTPIDLDVQWEWIQAQESIVIGVDAEAGTAFSMLARATPNAMVAVPDDGVDSKVVQTGKFRATAQPESSRQIETIKLRAPEQEFVAGTLRLKWGQQQENWYWTLAAPEGWFCGPGAFVVGPAGSIRLGGDSSGQS
jgi:hypothetical protein